MSKGFAERSAKMQDKAKEVMDEAGGVISRARGMFSGDAQFFSVIPSREQLRKALDDNNIGTKKDGMKGVLAQICLGSDMSPLFPDVVKNIHAPSIELRKFIYTFIVHYCDERPNEALLSISAFQRDLLDRSIHVRSLALRVLASIRISSIQPVVMLAIKKSMTDISPLVRRTAANALIKVARTSKSDASDQAVEVIAKLIGDRNMDVVGAAASAWLEICPTRYDLIHREFRKLCRSIGECNEWSQIPILRMLVRYCRTQFSDPNNQILERQAARKKNSAFSATSAAGGGAGGKKKKNKNNSDTDTSSDDDDDSSSSSSDSSSSDDDNNNNNSKNKKKSPNKKSSKKEEPAPAPEPEEDEDPNADFFNEKKSSKKSSSSSSPSAKKSSSTKNADVSSVASSNASSRAASPGSPGSVASGGGDMDLGQAMDLDSDLRLLLQSVKGLLHSANRSVVLHTIALYYHCAPTDMIDQCAKPLLRVLNGPKECVLPALVVANSLMARRLEAFTPYVQDFFPMPTDSLNERDLKLRIMGKLATRDNLMMLTKELTSHFRVMDTRHTISAIQGMVLIAFTVPNASRDILRQLLPLLQHRNSEVVSEVVVAVRQVVCLGHDATQSLRTIQQLARGILKQTITTPQARASVLWLVADNLRSHPTITKMAPDMFRTFLASFKEDALEVRRQLLFLGQKIFLNTPDTENDLTLRFSKMLQYLLELVKFDESYDLRDAGNALSAALDRKSEAYKLLKAADEHAAQQKPTPEIQDPFGDRSALELTSMSHLIGYSSLKGLELPDWSENCSASALRDSQDLKTSNSALLGSDTDSTTTEESDTTESTKSSSSSNSGSSSSSDSDSEQGAIAASSTGGKKPIPVVTATTTTATAAVKPKIQVNIKTIVKPTAPALGKGDRILQDFFSSSAPKPAGKSPALNATAPPKHVDPASKSDDES